MVNRPRRAVHPKPDRQRNRRDRTVDDYIRRRKPNCPDGRPGGGRGRPVPARSCRLATNRFRCTGFIGRDGRPISAEQTADATATT